MSTTDYTRITADLGNHPGAYVHVTQSANGELIVFPAADGEDRIVAIFGGYGGPTVSLTPEAWRIVIDTITAALNGVTA